VKFKRPIIIVASILTITGAVAYQNCQGTETRSADVDFSSGDVSTWANEVTCALGSGSTTADVSSTWTLFQNLLGQSGSDALYMEAPSGSIGPVSVVAPLSYASLRDDGGGVPQQIYAFFAVGADGTGALFIGLIDSSSTSGSPTATASASPFTTAANVQIKNKARTFFAKNSVKKDSTTGTSSTTCSSSNPLNLTAAIAGYNDGSEGLEMANFDDTSFEMQLKFENGNIITVTSYDIADGDLQDVILLQLTGSDSNGNDVDYGSINLSVPNS
jgi:hypothetical protein